MAGELVSFGIQKIWDLLSQECERFQGIEDQVTELKRVLRLLRSFLQDAGAKKHTTLMVKEFLEQIKEIIYDAEDEVETFLQKDKLEEPSGINNCTKILACIIPKRREIALSMQRISTRISNVICDMEKFGIIVRGMDLQPPQEIQNDWRQEIPKESESEFVGMEANVTKLVGYLVEQDNVQVISITGMGGIGKTTLARQAFNHELVKNKFDRLVWVCVTQVLNLQNVLQTILENLTPKENKKEILKMTEATLKKELFQLLETSRSLIVFDDIWKEQHWEQIRKIFPPRKDWKVLLTSRKEIVTVHRNNINFKPECLTTENSWTLFQMIALPRDGALEYMVDDEMQEMGKKMLEHCGGLPLAIRVLGGLLGAKFTLHDWKRVYDNIGSHLLEIRDSNDGKNNSVYRVLSLSFEELPSNLKICFLYLAHFPEDYQISVKKLSYYWAAEGIPRCHDGEIIQDAGDAYVEELVKRNMVISQRDIYSLRFETCHLHDMMREMCLSKAREENFLKIGGVHSPIGNSKSRRFVRHNTTTLDVERDIKNPKLRSLLIVNVERWGLSGLKFKRLELLRVLDLYFAELKGGKLPSGIGKLIHLRYLSLEMAVVSHDLPSSLGNLKLLIYLNLWILPGRSDVVVPNVLMGMKELRYLELPDNMDKKTKLELSNLEKLETLKNFSTKHCSLEDLRHMSRLMTLRISFMEASIETLSASIGGLKHLEDLHIDSDVKIEAGFIVNLVNLKQLRLYGICMHGLSKPFPSHLTTITLRNCGLEEDPMPILEKLPLLKDVVLGNSFCGRRMVCSGGGFPQLLKLVLVYMEKLEEWIVEEGCMPLLRVLYIENCKELKEFPDGLRYLISLKEMAVYDIGEEWEKRLSEGGEDYYKVQHIPSVTFLK